MALMDARVMALMGTDGPMRLSIRAYMYTIMLGTYGTTERYDVNLRRAGSHPRGNSRYCFFVQIIFIELD